MKSFEGLSDLGGDDHAPGRDLTPPQAEALNWLTLMLSGRATKADIAAMERWREQSTENAEALAAAVKLRRIVSTQDQIVCEEYRPAFFERRSTRRLVLGGAGVLCASYLVVRPPMGMWPSLAELGSDYRTRPGEQQLVALGDGVEVHLNTRTSVALPQAGRRPGIELIDGEVLVRANLPSSRQFTAYFGQGQIGTSNGQFDLCQTPDGFRATCVTGTISVAHAQGRATLHEGHAIVIRRGIPDKEVAVDTHLATAWTRGQLIFRDAPFREVVAEINRYRAGRVIIMAPGLGNQRFNGVFEIGNIENVVADLQKISNASATKLPGGIILLT